MRQRAAALAAGFYGWSMAFMVPLWAQTPTPEDNVINAIRTLPQISANDQSRIAAWLQVQVERLSAAEADAHGAASSAFRQAIRSQYDNNANSQPFRAQLAAQTAVVAAAQFSKPKLDGFVASALARALVDMNRIETLPGLIAGLKSPDESTRYLSAQGMALQRSAIAADKDKLNQTLSAVREAAMIEMSPVVLRRLYLALGHPNQVAIVFDAYLAIFDRRLADRRKAPGLIDGAEADACEFFRSTNVLSSLTPEQKAQLVRPFAVFLRLDAERYNDSDLSFDQMEMLERLLDGEESILSELVGAGKGGKIRDLLASSGHEKRADVLAEAYKWIGHPESKEPGALSTAPWNLPPGAP